MQQSESHESLVKQLTELTGKVYTAIDAEGPDELAALADKSRSLATSLAEQGPDPDDPEALGRLVNARDRISEARAALLSKRNALVEELHALETRKAIGKAYRAGC